MNIGTWGRTGLDVEIQNISCELVGPVLGETKLVVGERYATTKNAAILVDNGVEALTAKKRRPKNLLIEREVQGLLTEGHIPQRSEIFRPKIAR